MQLPAMFVCLSVSKITQKCVHGFGWNSACRQMSGHRQTDQLLRPIRIIVQMPEPENLKVEYLSKSVKQAPYSEQATGHVMHCREIAGGLFLYDVRLRSYRPSNLPNFRILAFVGGTCAPPSDLLVKYCINFILLFQKMIKHTHIMYTVQAKINKYKILPFNHTLSDPKAQCFQLWKAILLQPITADFSFNHSKNKVYLTEFSVRDT